MNNFSINRFGKTLRWVLANNLRTQIAWTIGSATAVFLLQLILIALRSAEYDNILYADVSGICASLLWVYILVVLSTAFSTYAKKEKRESLLMLPATNLEKFLSIVFYVTVVCTLTGILSYIIGDTLRMAVRALLFGNEWITTIPHVLNNMVSIFDKSPYFIYAKSFAIMRIICIITVPLWIHSLFILGSTLMRKYSFVITGLVMIISIWFYAKTTNLLGLNGSNNEFVVKDGVQYVVLHATQLQYIGALLTLSFAVINYRVAFRIFKGYQLITNKWTNYDILKR
ncbi:MAG: hypothetical protein IJ081_04495 [Prevotella sp.]|nr:hypothetical protein [Prevotella sp.]